MIKRLLKYFIVILLSLLASQCLFYYILDDYIVRILNSSVLSNLGMRILVAFIVYFICISILDLRIKRININILTSLYFLIVLELSFFRERMIYSSVNFNPLTIIDDFTNYFNHTLIILIANLFVYLPIGVYVKYRFDIGNRKSVAIFTLYIIVLEVFQGVFNLGVCDINDVILNTLGFFIGIKIFNIFIKQRDKRIEYL